MNEPIAPDRCALLPYLGLPVHVEGAVARWGTAPLGGGETIFTLMLKDLHLNGAALPEVDHLWFRLGRTGSGRLRPLISRLDALRCSLDALVLPYPREDGQLSLGLARASEVRLHGEGRDWVLNRRVEAVHSEEFAQAEQAEYDRLRYEAAYHAQSRTMRRLAQHGPRQKHLRSAVQRYFVRRTPVTPGQLRAALSFLETGC